ncbi:hypothetical protein K443DRAFT_8721 [Laccaria amethystina LaAM-08-1]|uniref:Uncharacterized protein n=1 Tax=Laccaria amethystina LaAM-08-1 TaxID=1095629 RepID=A0A0C9XC38_9AGAR|nr:hypothetical protein K443DRAFT_8721 [Laccaria amethystina LaAM-08-1]
MPMDPPQIIQLLESVGADLVNEYISEIFTAPVVTSGWHKIENAPDWIDMSAFMGWMSRRLQSQPKSQSTPILTDSDGSSIIELISVPSTMAPQRHRKVSSTGKKRHQKSSPIDSQGSDSEVLDMPSTAAPPQHHRKTAQSQKKHNTAYLLDLSDDPHVWEDESGKSLSMATILKSEDQDSWGGGSCGSIKPAKTPKGVYHCSEIDPSLLDSCERYEPDKDERQELFNTEREINVDETSIVELQAVAFVKEAEEIAYPAVNEGGIPCSGVSVYRKMNKVSS